MPTKLLMSVSAALLAVAGAVLSFLPQELLAHAGLPVLPVAVTAIQLLGTLYLSFAILNWMARGNLIGGIYSRPVALGNFLHFAVGAVTFIKVIVGGLSAWPWLVAGLIYSALGIAFGLVLFGTPSALRDER